MTSMTSVPQDSEEIFESNWVLRVLNPQVGFHHQCALIYCVYKYYNVGTSEEFPIL